MFRKNKLLSFFHLFIHSAFPNQPLLNQETISQVDKEISLLGTEEFMYTKLKHQHIFVFSVVHTSIFSFI